jgi:DNA-binding response OmpR family regulator
MSTAPHAAEHAPGHAPGTGHGADPDTGHETRLDTGPTGTEHPGPTQVAADTSAERTLTVLVYSDDPKTREQVMLAVGRRPATDLPRLDYVDLDQSEAVVEVIEDGGVDLAILDGEAAPVGGMGLCRQLKNEIRHCPAILLLTGRRDDRWLAVWSQADGAVPHPIDAMVLVDTVVDLLRSVPRRAAVTRPR